MSLPLLTPLESAIFDEDVIADLEAHDEDTPTCTAIDAPAVASLVLLCCSASYLVCARHLGQARQRVAKRPALRCLTCGHLFKHPTFDATYRVVPL